MTELQQERLNPAEVAALYVKHADTLRRFLRGVLRDSELANDVLQITFAKLLEVGHTTREESRRAWLFQVAYHEAMAIRRRLHTGQRVLQRVAWMRASHAPRGDDALVRRETIECIREELGNLPASQQQIVRMRIYDAKTFAEISRDLKIPIGTALGRMRAALKKLRRSLGPENMDAPQSHESSST